MPWYWHIGTFLGFFYMGTRAHFCTPNPSARVASSTQSKWPVACQTSPGSLSIGPTPILKLGVLLGHSSLSPATASAYGAGEQLLEPFAFGAVPRQHSTNSEICSRDVYSKSSANYLESTISSESAHFLSHASVVLVQLALAFGCRSLLSTNSILN